MIIKRKYEWLGSSQEGTGDKIMIILITGASHTGKTLLAQRLLENDQDLIIEGCYVPADWRQDFDENYLKNIRFICLAMTEEYIEDHFDDIIGHESEIESRLIKEDCTINDLKQCNRWFIDTFGSAGEMVMLIEDDFGKALAGISSSLT